MPVNMNSIWRKKYLELLLRKLCIDIGPRPAGSSSYNRSVNIIKNELEKCGGIVEVDKFYFDYWELKEDPVFLVGNKELEIWPYYASRSTPESGINGKLKLIKDIEPLFGICDPDTDKIVAYIDISPFGKAVPRFAWKSEYRDFSAVNLGKQDQKLLERVIREGTSVYVKYKAEITANKESCSIIGYLPGESEDEIVLIAHADTHSNTPGANDNTATLITLLMMAHYFSHIKHKYSLTLIASGGEEVGHLGSAHYVETRKRRGDINRIKVCVNFDSLTYGPDLMIHSRNKQLSSLIKEIHNDLKLKGTPKIINEDDVLDGSAFIEEDIRCVYINSRGDDQSKLKLWHRPEDRPKEVSFELVENGFLVFTEFIKRIGDRNIL